jgi:hypothetical protein
MKLGPAGKSSLSRNESKYDSTHGYVAPDQTDRFVASFIATFGGIEQAGPQGVGRGNTTFLFSCPQGSETSMTRGSGGIRNRFAPELCAEKALSDQGSTRFAAAVALMALVMPLKDLSRRLT